MRFIYGVCFYDVLKVDVEFEVREVFCWDVFVVFEYCVDFGCVGGKGFVNIDWFVFD